MAEARALAHPLRLRILRLCLDEARTNNELAVLLGEAAATTLHHVRTLVHTGFLERVASRPGPRGTTEKPYLSTGLSWHLDLRFSLDSPPLLTTIDAVREELVAAGPDGILQEVRLALRLPARATAGLVERLQALVDGLAAEEWSTAGEPTALYVLLHRR